MNTAMPMEKHQEGHEGSLLPFNTREKLLLQQRVCSPPQPRDDGPVSAHPGWWLGSHAGLQRAGNGNISLSRS